MHRQKGFTPLEERRCFLMGFTLIELLVVISIIVLLVAILLPTLQRVKKQAKAAACQSNLKQWGTIFAMYTDNNDGLCPRQKFHSLATPEPWMYLLQDYSGGPEGISCCPMATKPANPIAQDPAKILGFNRVTGDDVTGATLLAWGKLMFNIEGSQTPAYYGSYGMNNWLSMPQEGGRVVIGCGRSMEQYKKSFWRTSNVNGAGNIPIFLDGLWWCSWVKDTDKPPEFEGQKIGFPCGCRDSIQRFCINRHNGFVNAVFLDGSVRKVGLKELWRLKWHQDFNTNSVPPVWPQWMRRFKDY